MTCAPPGIPQGGQPTSSAGGSGAPGAPAAGGFSLLHLLLVAVLAFLIGHIANVFIPFVTSRLQGAGAA